MSLTGPGKKMGPPGTLLSGNSTSSAKWDTLPRGWRTQKTMTTRCARGWTERTVSPRVSLRSAAPSGAQGPHSTLQHQLLVTMETEAVRPAEPVGGRPTSRAGPGSGHVVGQ